MKPFIPLVVLLLVLHATPTHLAQEKEPKQRETFDKAELLSVRGDRTESTPVRLRFDSDSLIVESRKTGATLLTLKYSDIVSAEYSYSKHPRWKAGVATAAAATVVCLPLLILALPIAIPLAFSKSKRHWLTIRMEGQYAVLKLDKTNRKLVLPALEVRTGKRVEALGESK